MLVRMTEQSNPYVPILPVHLGWMFGELIAVCSRTQDLVQKMVLDLMADGSSRGVRHRLDTLPLAGMKVGLQLRLLRSMVSARMTRADAESAHRCIAAIEQVFGFKDRLVQSVWTTGRDGLTIVVDAACTRHKDVPRCLAAGDISRQIVTLATSVDAIVRSLNAYGYAVAATMAANDERSCDREAENTPAIPAA